MIQKLRYITRASYAQLMIWMIFALLLIYAGPRGWSIPLIVIWGISNTLIYAICTNINLKLLFPKFLRNGSFLIYIGSILGICLIAAPLQSLMNQYFCNLESVACNDWINDQRFHFISLLIITSISTFARIPLDWLTVQKEKQSLQTKNIETELNMLKNQINPHFLFNTLNNLYALSLKKSDYAPELILKLSDMLRYMLYECNEERVFLEKEIQYIRNYIDLEKIRLSQSADIQIEIIGEVSAVKVAPLLFIPFIENSFKHGLKLSSNQSFIKIKFEISNTIKFSIMNSKPQPMPGFKPMQSVGGIGLTNVRKRLELIYPGSYKLNIDNQLDSYTVELELLTNKI
ncbi:MAG: sensor histidine kinase [Saprospiraceae bacterium]|nr:sensor histidine kinase [Saprospiraceae bacterium]